MKKTFYKNFPKIPPLDYLDILCGKANIKSRSRLDLAIVIFKNYANVAWKAHRWLNRQEDSQPKKEVKKQ